MPECIHTITLVGDGLQCTNCRLPVTDRPIPVDAGEVVRLIRLAQGIADTLELAGLHDTAKRVREQSTQLIVQPTMAWRE